MSLLLKMRPWISMDDAIGLAIVEKLIADIPKRESEEYGRLKTDICLAYFAQEKSDTRLCINGSSLYWRDAYDWRERPPEVAAKRSGTGWYVDLKLGTLTRINCGSVCIKFEESNSLSTSVTGLRTKEGLDEESDEIIVMHDAPAIYAICESDDKSEQTRFKLVTWRDLITGEFQSALEVHTESFLSFLRKTTQTEAHKPLPNTVGSKLTLNEDDLPPRTANKIYKEYKAMAITIAHLSGQKWGDYRELAAIVMSACAEADNDMPTEKRTVEKRINKG